MGDFHLISENTIRMDVLMLNQFMTRYYTGFYASRSLSYLTSFPPFFIPSISRLPLPFILLLHVYRPPTPPTPA